MFHADAPVPTALRHADFTATPLTTADAARDHAAYLASRDVIRVHSDGRWPVHGFTVSDNRDLIAVHEADHASRRAFTFLLSEPTEREALGCLYLNPLHPCLSRAGADPRTLSAFPPSSSAMVTFWIRQDHQETYLPAVVTEAVNTWLLTKWAFTVHLFRILPEERSSFAALEALPLRRVSLRLPEEHRPYLWYQPLEDS